MLAPPVHTTAPMRTLCASVLRSVILTSNSQPNKKQEEDSENDDLMEVDQTELSDDETPKRRRRPEPKEKDEDSTNIPDLADIMAESTSWTSILV